MTANRRRLPRPLWDFFLAHASRDASVAQQIYEALKPHSKVFLDTSCLTLGDDWPKELANAQQRSRITVVGFGSVNGTTDNSSDVFSWPWVFALSHVYDLKTGLDSLIANAALAERSCD